MSGKLPIEKGPVEKRPLEKHLKLELKREKLEKEKPEFKETKHEAKELKNEKFEVKEVKREKIEIKELKVEIKEHLKSEFEVPPIDFPVGPGPGPLARQQEMAGATSPGDDPAARAVSPEQLAAHAEALEAAARQLRHFIAESERPDLSQGALKDEPDEES